MLNDIIFKQIEILLLMEQRCQTKGQWLMSKRGKVIYTKRIKELLEDEYNIYPIIRIDNPRDHNLTAWVFEENSEFIKAIAKISRGQGDNSYGTNSNNT